MYVHIGKNSIYRVQFYLRFHAFTGVILELTLWIRMDHRVLVIYWCVTTSPTLSSLKATHIYLIALWVGNLGMTI